MSAAGFSWTIASITQTAALFAENRTVAHIASQSGCSRSAIQRLRAEWRAGVDIVARVQYRLTNPRPRDITTMQHRSEEQARIADAAYREDFKKYGSCFHDAEPGEGASLALVRGCRWPLACLNSAAEFMCDAAVSKRGSSYCAYHARMATRQPYEYERKALAFAGRAR